MSDLSELFGELLRLIGISVEGDSERVQALAFFAFCTLFGLVAGCFTTELTSKIWFVFAGFCSLAFLFVVCRKEE